MKKDSSGVIFCARCRKDMSRKRKCHFRSDTTSEILPFQRHLFSGAVFLISLKEKYVSSIFPGKYFSHIFSEVV